MGWGWRDKSHPEESSTVSSIASSTFRCPASCHSAPSPTPTSSRQSSIRIATALLACFSFTDTSSFSWINFRLNILLTLSYRVHVTLPRRVLYFTCFSAYWRFFFVETSSKSMTQTMLNYNFGNFMNLSCSNFGFLSWKVIRFVRTKTDITFLSKIFCVKFCIISLRL